MKEQEDEELLKDICARIPYGVIGAVEHYDETTKEPAYLLGALWGIDGYNRVQFAYLPEYADDEGAYNYFDFKLFKPYLRPMSSMTEEEWNDLIMEQTCGDRERNMVAKFDWLNKNKFDYRGLIPKGRAIEVTKDDNPYKDLDYENLY